MNIASIQEMLDDGNDDDDYFIELNKVMMSFCWQTGMMQRQYLSVGIEMV